MIRGCQPAMAHGCCGNAAEAAVLSLRRPVAVAHHLFAGRFPERKEKGGPVAGPALSVF